VTLSTPLFSVIVPTHGRASLIAELLQSLSCTPSSIDASVEVLIVDSSSVGESEAIRETCERFGAKHLEGSVSVRRKRNIGAFAANGEWLFFVDSDCAVSPDIFAAYQRTMRSTPDLCAAAGPTVFRGDETSFTRRIRSSSLFGPFRRPAQVGSLLWTTTSNLLIRRDVFHSLGGFREDYPFRLGGDDTDLCLRLRDEGKVVIAVPEAVCFHSWATWSSPWLVVRRSFRWGWMHARLLRDHPRYRRFDAPGLPAHALICVAISTIGAMFGVFRLIVLPVALVAMGVLFHALVAAARAQNRLVAFGEDITLALVELPFGFGRAIGSLAAGSLIGVLYRLDADDRAMDEGFTETVVMLWCDHLALVVLSLFVGWLTWQPG
jgi:GT2 family glycosyltransferase